MLSMQFEDDYIDMQLAALWSEIMEHRCQLMTDVLFDNVSYRELIVLGDMSLYYPTFDKARLN